MARVYMAMFFLGLIFAMLALISCLSAEDGEVRGLPRLLWVLVILLFPLLGSMAYYFTGRPIKAEATGQAGGEYPRWRLGGGLPEPPRRVVAPDDDPEFLRSINPNPPRAQNGPPDDKSPPAEATG